MKTRNKLGLVALVFALACNAQEKNISAKVVVSNIPVKKGVLFVGWYNNAKTFPDELKPVYFQKAQTNKQKSATLIFNDLKAGVYAIAVFYDENGNEKLDTNFLGIPSEAYGFSNNSYPKFRGATFEEAKFVLKQNNQLISIEMR